MKLRTHLLDIGFTSSNKDTSLFIHHAHGHITSNNSHWQQHILYTKFNYATQASIAMKDLGPLHYFLRIEVNRSNGEMFLSQTRYIVDLLNRANMLGAKPISSPT